MFIKMKISVSRCLKSKAVKEHMNKRFETCKILCNFQKLYTAFKGKHRNVNIEFSKFCALRSKWCVLAGSRVTHSVCICSALQNCVVSRCNGLGLDIQRPCFAWSISIKTYLQSLLYHYHSQGFFFYTGTSLVHLIWKCSW